MPVFVRDNGVWRDVAKPHERAAGVWRWASQFYNRTAAVWQQVYDDPTPPPQPPPVLPLVDTNLQNTAENPQAGQINSLINTTYASIWNNSSAFEDGTGAGRGFVNSNGDNVGWSLSNNPSNFSPGPFSIYFECRYRGFGVSNSNRYGFIIEATTTGAGTPELRGILIEGGTTVDLLFQDSGGELPQPITITIPKTGVNGWESGFPIRHLLRFNGNNLSVEIEINGTTYTGSESTGGIDGISQANNIFPGSAAYQWFRFMVFNEAITDAFYNAEIRGKRNDF